LQFVIYDWVVDAVKVLEIFNDAQALAQVLLLIWLVQL